MKKILLILLNIYCILNSQTKTFSGVVYDNETKAPVPNVNISTDVIKSIYSTDFKGRYLIQLSQEPSIQCEFTHVGYKTISQKLVAGIENIIYLEPTQFIINEIKVSSLRYDKLLKEIPIPFAVVGNDRFYELSALTISDALKSEPGLSLMRDGIWGTNISIRGLSKSNIVLLINGNRLETATEHAAALSMVFPTDIERVEVIKGAGSSIYGTGALGGVINIITKRASYTKDLELHFSLTSGYNSVNRGSFGSGRITVSNEFMHLNLSGNIRSATDINTPEGVLKNSRFHDNSVNVELGVIPFNKHELLLTYQNFDAIDVGIPGASSLFPSIADVRYPTEKRDMFSVEYNINDITKYLKKLSIKYFYHEIFRDVENITNQVIKAPKKVTYNLSILPLAFHKINGGQLQSNISLGSDNLAIFGFDIWQRNMDSRRTRNQLIIDTLTDGSTKETRKTTFEKPIPNASYTSAGFYLQNEQKFFHELLVLNFGGRIDKIFIKNEATRNPVYEVINGIQNDMPTSSKLLWSDSSHSDISWSGNFNVLYKLTDPMSLSFSFSRAFRSPSLEERYQFIDQGSLVKLGNVDLKPEEGYFFDFGIKYSDRTINSGFNVFLNILKNQVVDVNSLFEQRKALVKQNVGKSRLFGFDMSLEYNFYAKLISYISGSFVNGEDTENKIPLPAISPFNSRFGLKGEVFDLFRFDAVANIFAEQNKIATGELATPGYATFDLYISSKSIRYNTVEISLATGIENILDRGYRNHLSTNRGSITIEPGRNFFLKLSITR